VGSLLGQHDINIAEMQLGRRQARDKAVMVLGIDENPSPEVLASVVSLAGIEQARIVHI
jgi:D-3-phosphoglycerate dehydrogenase